MDCEICGAEIKTGIMGKLKGTYLTEGKKHHAVCSSCQKEGESALKEKLKGKV